LLPPPGDGVDPPPEPPELLEDPPVEVDGGGVMRFNKSRFVEVSFSETESVVSYVLVTVTL
jgi:hypothetical protein